MWQELPYTDFFLFLNSTPTGLHGGVDDRVVVIMGMQCELTPCDHMLAGDWAIRKHGSTPAVEPTYSLM